MEGQRCSCVFYVGNSGVSLFRDDDNGHKEVAHLLGRGLGASFKVVVSFWLNTEVVLLRELYSVHNVYSYDLDGWSFLEVHDVAVYTGGGGWDLSPNMRDRLRDLFCHK